MKSFTDCLNFIDNLIIYNVEKVDSMDGLEIMRDFNLDDYIKKTDEELAPIKSILSQINLIINRFYIPEDYNIIGYHYDLKKCMLTWLKHCYGNINSEMNIHYYLKLRIPIIHRQFFRKISQNHDYIQTFCKIHLILHDDNGIHTIIHSFIIVYLHLFEYK